MVVDSVTDDSTTVTVWLSGGACGEVSELLVTITTAAGRTLQRSVFVEFRQ